MIPMLKRSLDRGLEINDRVALSLLNGFDWVFKRDQLVQSGRTPFPLNRRLLVGYTCTRALLQAQLSARGCS